MGAKATKAVAAATLLVGGPRVEVALPGHVVVVELAARGIEEPDLVDDVGEQFDVVADHDQSALVRLEETAQPVDRVGVEVVGGLVEQQDRLGLATGAGLGRGEQDPGELDTAALPARECLQCLREHAVGQAQVGADPGGFALGRVTAEGSEALFEAAVAVDGLVPGGLVDELGHSRLRLLHVPHQRVEPASGEHAVLRGDREVTLARVLREVTDVTGDADLAGMRFAFAGEHLQRGGLAGAVAADEADAVALLDAQGGVGEEDARAGAQLHA